MDARTVGFLVALAVAGTAPAARGQGYTGSRACAGCHADLYKRWVQSPMGRSMTPARQHLDKAEAAARITHDGFGREFRAHVEDGVLLQSETGPGFAARHALEYAIGSGINGYTFAVRRDGFLFQAPLSYYTRPRQWALSPGYEFADYGFSRPLHTACIACHSGRARPGANGNGQYLDPPFEELAIGCENCHGPGRAHVAAAGRKTAIVNPAKLPPAAAEEICMNCHQGGDTRVLLPGKTALDFRPGQRLGTVVAIFRFPGEPDASGAAGLLEHHESMRLSQCFQKSTRMTCLTCHDPHAAAPDYRSQCLKCHTAPLAASHPPRSSNCIACHMPKRDVGVIAHSALTEHRIPRTPEAAPAPPVLDDLRLFNPVPGKPLPPVTMLEAYGQLLDKQPRFLERFQALLDRLAQSDAGDPTVLAALGRRALRNGDSAQAAVFLEKATQAGSKASTTFEDWAEALARTDRTERAVDVLREGLRIAPFVPVLHKSLALRLINLKRYAEARQTLERYVELFPEDDFMRGLLQKVSRPGG